MITRSAASANRTPKHTSANIMEYFNARSHDFRFITTSPGSGLVVVVRIIMIRDLCARGFPNAFVTANVVEGLIEILDAKRQTDDEWMQWKGHDPRLSRALGVKRVELIANHLQPILGRVASLKDHPDVVEPLLVWNADHPPGVDAHLYRLIVAPPVAHIVKTFCGKMIQRVGALVPSSRPQPAAWRLSRRRCDGFFNLS